MNNDMTFRQLLKVRDALKEIVSYGYDLKDLLNEIEQEIAQEVESIHDKTNEV